jgi:hypothetical protein
MLKAVVHGATPDDWLHFDLVLGLGADLLPVVSNPMAEIAPDSKLKGLGKTPSRYNRARKVAGIADWTKHQASDQDLARWSREPDYGICVQTRIVRALDIDVPDPALAQAIEVFVLERLGQQLPARRRANSGKVLLAFQLIGEFAKRKLVVEGGIVEFLANGQQFVAVGAHFNTAGPSGARYEWDGGLPLAIPELDVAEFEALWSAMAERFAVEDAGAAGALTLRKKGEHQQLADPVAEFLADQGLVLGEQHDGSLMVACPWEGEHSTGTAGDGSTVWFPAGTNGYERGHFKCLHGHCTGRSDGDFFHAIGYLEGDFEVVEAPAGEPEAKPLPAFKRDKHGAIEATLGNVLAALRRSDVAGVQIGHDRFNDELMIARDGTQEWRQFTDEDYTRLREHLARKGFKEIGRELMRDAVGLVAAENAFDSAQLWLESLPAWDGVPRVETFLARYFNAEDTAYTRAVSLYMWTAMAGRVIEPGVQADMVPVLLGGQGLRKTSGVKALVPGGKAHYVEVNLAHRDDNLARSLRGKLVGELGELRGLASREAEDIKAWISRTHEEWVPKYKEFAIEFPRRLLLIGTSNQPEFLVDTTGNRRWLPLHVGLVDTDAIAAARDQLWAEARDLFTVLGVAWQDAERLAAPVHADHMVSDSWEDAVGAWLDAEDLDGTSPRTRKFLRLGDVLQGALNLDPRSVKRADERRLGDVLRSLGYERAKVWDGSRAIWAYRIPLIPLRGGAQ